MTTDIHNFIEIIRQKNGRFKIKHSISNEANIYKWLRDFGFRKTTLDKKRIFILRQSNKIIPVNLWDLKDAFKAFLMHGDFTNIPTNISKDDILEWYYSSRPIKENGLFDHYLKDKLTENEVHELRLLYNLISI